MKKGIRFPLKRRLLAGLMAVLCIAGLMAGCNIEFPEDVTASSSAVSDTVSSEYRDVSSRKETISSVSSGSSSKSTGESASSEESRDAEAESAAATSGTENSAADQGTSSAAAEPPAASSSKEPDPPASKPDKPKEEPNKPTCTMSITCKTILDNMDQFREDKLSVLPRDGIIYPEQTITFEEGDTVFDVLARETKRSGIHMEHEYFPLYQAEYIEGINNIYEFDCGEGSGWMIKVNGAFLTLGCSLVEVHQGDQIEWIYTCDLGYDLGHPIT